MWVRSLPILMLVSVSLSASAHARFGKRSSTSQQEKEEKKEKKKATASPQPVSGPHLASAVGGPGPSVYAPVRHAPVRVYTAPRVRRVSYVTYEPAGTISGGGSRAGGQPSSSQITFFGEAMGFAEGGLLGAGLMVEGDRWGLSGNGGQLILLADDGSEDIDTLTYLNVHLTYALLKGDRGRLRLEAGLDTIAAPDLLTVGPTVGTSAVLWLGGPLSLDGAVFATVFPHRQLDMRGGVLLGLGPLELRAGWRRLLLNDAGLVDGVEHQDIFNGPYVSAGLWF